MKRTSRRPRRNPEPSHRVPAWLLQPQRASAYALEHFPDAYRDQQFEEDAEDRVHEYSRFASRVSAAGSASVYRAFDVPLESLDFLNLGKSWSARLDRAHCYGGGRGQGWGKAGQCQVVIEGVLAAGDVDWPYSFESFLMYGPSQWEIAPRSHAPILVTAFFPLRDGRRASDQDRQVFDPPIAGYSGKALEEWEPVSRNRGSKRTSRRHR